MTTKVDIVTGLTDVSAQDASIGLFKTSRTEASLKPERMVSKHRQTILWHQLCNCKMAKSNDIPLRREREGGVDI